MSNPLNFRSEDATAENWGLITGASSGIGRTLAIQLSARMRLVLHGRDRDRLASTLSACANPETHTLWPYDLRDVDGIERSLSELMQKETIEIGSFIHSAGLLRILPVRTFSSAVFGEIMAVNVISAAAIASFLSRKRVNGESLKNVLFISSIAGKFGARGFSMYSASKGALDALMRSLAVEMAPQVRVNSILPGAISTPMTREMLEDPGVLTKFERDYPLGIGQEEDVTNMVEFLLSPRARWITGQEIVVDGGRTINISI